MVTLTNDSQTHFNGTLSDLSAGTHSLRAFCLDTIGNGDSSRTVTFTITAPTVATSSSSGGSSGERTNAQNYSITKNTLEKGITLNLSYKDTVLFTLYNEEHSLKVFWYNATSARITLHSESFNLSAQAGADMRVDSNADGQDDLLIRYEGITIGKAQLFIQTIKQEVLSTASTTEEQSTEAINQQPSTPSTNYTSIIVGIIIILLLIYGVTKVYGRSTKSFQQRVKIAPR